MKRLTRKRVELLRDSSDVDVTVGSRNDEPKVHFRIGGDTTWPQPLINIINDNDYRIESAEFNWYGKVQITVRHVDTNY